MTLEDKLYLKMKKYSEQFKNSESCGLLYKDFSSGDIEFEECKNIHPEPEKFFEISPKEYLRTSSKGEITAAFHSHPFTEGPSERDIHISKNLQIPFVIYSLKTKKFYYTE